MRDPPRASNHPNGSICICVLCSTERAGFPPFRRLSLFASVCINLSTILAEREKRGKVEWEEWGRKEKEQKLSARDRYNGERTREWYIYG